VLKRQNRRVYLVAFLDDHSRFLVGYGLHASQSTALVLEVLRAALSGYGPPKEVLTDNGSQYVTCSSPRPCRASRARLLGSRAGRTARERPGQREGTIHPGWWRRRASRLVRGGVT
jgi:transposase InsO family protein